MKKFVLHNENNINNIKSYKDHFGDFLNIQADKNVFLKELNNCAVFSKDFSQRSLYEILTKYNQNNEEDSILINACSFDYLVFKDKFLIKNNAYLILDSALFAANILNINKVDIVIHKYYLEEKDILIKSVVEAEEHKFADDIKINIFDNESYYEEYKIKISPHLIENKKYIFDLDTITQLGYLAHIGEFNFKNYGKKKSKGTCILSLSGDINNPNIYEFEISSSFKNIIKTVGGINKDYSIKCVFTNSFLNPPIDYSTFIKMILDYESFESLGLKIGNGGICFIREDRCMIRVILKIIQFAKSVSCQKCMPCNYGFDLCIYYINRIMLGKSAFNDFNNLKDTVQMIKSGAYCLYIRLLANCILSSIEMFQDEFIYAIENKVALYSFIKD